MRLELLLVAMGCKFSASSKVGDTGGSSEWEGPLVEEDEDPDTGSNDEIDPLESDDDSDGYTEVEGDCDDDDASIRPGLSDVCDGADNDCDDVIDEDAHTEDVYEPNDTIDYDLGDLDAQESGTFEVVGFLFDEDDVDGFKFLYSDSWIDVDSLQVTLSDLADDITYKMEIVNIDDDEEIFEDFNTAGDEAITFELDGGLWSDSAVFRVKISSLGGAGCMTPYTLSIVHGDWWGMTAR